MPSPSLWPVISRGQQISNKPRRNKIWFTEVKEEAKETLVKNFLDRDFVKTDRTRSSPSTANTHSEEAPTEKRTLQKLEAVDGKDPVPLSPAKPPQAQEAGRPGVTAAKKRQGSLILQKDPTDLRSISISRRFLLVKSSPPHPLGQIRFIGDLRIGNGMGPVWRRGSRRFIHCRLLADLQPGGFLHHPRFFSFFPALPDWDWGWPSSP